jgi:hypothetical protein
MWPLLRWLSDGVSWFAWVVMVCACCVLVTGGRLPISPFSWRGWCRCGECGGRGIAVGVRVLTRRVSCHHCACVAVVYDAGRCSGGSSDSRSHRGEWSCGPFVAASPAWSRVARLMCCCCHRHVLLRRLHSRRLHPALRRLWLVCVIAAAADDDAACDVSVCVVASPSLSATGDIGEGRRW